jgi:DNA polymerase-3 subunit epsilon
MLGGWFSRRGAEPSRWIVLDVETSGLDAARDRLIAIAAVALRVDWERRVLALVPADSFEVVLRQEAVGAPDRDNILLHGIGLKRQGQGVEPAEALAQFEGYAADAPLLAFHEAFDRTLLSRYGRMALGRVPGNEWVDIEHLCAVLHPSSRARSLDEWLSYFRIPCTARHEAAADVLAEAELLQRIWPQLAQECSSWREVKRIARARRWAAAQS